MLLGQVWTVPGGHRECSLEYLPPLEYIIGCRMQGASSWPWQVRDLQEERVKREGMPWCETHATGKRSLPKEVCGLVILRARGKQCVCELYCGILPELLSGRHGSVFMEKWEEKPD